MLRLGLVSLLALVTLTSASVTLSSSDIQEFLDVHNAVRAATGANIPALQWSSTLASYAETMADNCVYQHDPAQTHGENVFMAYYEINDNVEAAAAASSGWAAEISNVDADWGCILKSSMEETCGHYSQQVWKTTTEVGCAINICSGNTLIFCEYNPAGNVMNYDYDTEEYSANPPY